MFSGFYEKRLGQERKRSPKCFGKVPYERWALAQQVAKRYRRKTTKQRTDVYRCLGCGKFHVGRNLSRVWRG